MLMGAKFRPKMKPKSIPTLHRWFWIVCLHLAKLKHQNVQTNDSLVWLESGNPNLTFPINYSVFSKVEA